MRRICLSKPSIRSLHFSAAGLSGSNKWSKIRHIKGAKDAEKSLLWGKVTREIVMAVKASGADPLTNDRLKSIVERARNANVSKQVVEQAIAKAVGGRAEEAMESVLYDGIGPGGAGLIIECITDNRNRSSRSVKDVLRKFGGTMAASQYMFERKGIITISNMCLEKGLDVGLDIGADDVRDIGDDQVEILVNPHDTYGMAGKVKEMVSAEIVETTIGWVPINTTELSENDKSSLANLMDKLNADDDVSNVYATADV